MRIDNAMETPQAMAAAYRAQFGRMLDVVDRIPAELAAAPIHGDWTIKEVLVHLTGWDRAVTASAADVLEGRPPRLLQMRLEDVNEDEVDGRRDATLDDVRAELDEGHRALVEQVLAIPAERWHDALPDACWHDGSPMTPASVFAYQYRGLTHYGGHAEEVEAWLQTTNIDIT